MSQIGITLTDGSKKEPPSKKKVDWGFEALRLLIGIVVVMGIVLLTLVIYVLKYYTFLIPLALLICYSIGRTILKDSQL